MQKTNAGVRSASCKQCHDYVGLAVNHLILLPKLHRRRTVGFTYSAGLFETRLCKSDGILYLLISSTNKYRDKFAPGYENCHAQHTKQKMSVRTAVLL